MQKDTNKVVISTFEDIMGDRFGRYSKYIIQERALPDARDGLKPVQRRILYAMQEEGNTHDKSYRKSAKSVGIIMGNYHPHGDSSIYDAMVRLSQDWKSRVPLIDMQGNNGSIDDDPAAAMRYTEVRLAPIAQMMLQDIEKNTVVFAPNFDDSEEEPTVLPARYPNLLVNGISGIAAGYATNIAPHNLNEVIDATIYRMQNKDCSVDDLLEYIQGPDFPTGGIVQGIEGIKEAFTSGKGKVIIKGKAEVVQTKTIQQIVIHEIPYDVIKCNLVKKMDDIRLNKDFEGIIDVRDESDRNGLRIVVDLKKDVDANLVLNYFYKHTDLQVSFNYNNVAIVNKRPMLLSLPAMLDAFIEHRREVVLRRSRYELERKEKRCHILEGLIRVISILDEIIHLIRHSKDKADAKTKLMQKFNFSEMQAEAIVTLRLYRLTNTDVVSLQEEFALLVNQMEELKDILENHKSLQRVIIKELKEVKKLFSSERKSKIEAEIETIVIDKTQMIPNDRYMVTVSKDGYAKRVSLRSYAASENTFTGSKEGDHVVGSSEANNLDYLLFFTQSGTYGYLPVYEIQEHRWKDVGTHLNTKIKMQVSEKIVGAFLLSSFKQAGYFVLVSSHGLTKKTSVTDFEVTRTSKTMNCMNLHKEDHLVSVTFAYDEEQVVLTTKNGYAAKYELGQIPASATKSKGVKAMNLNKDEIVSIQTIQASTTHVLVVSESGGLKRIRIEDIEVMNRPVKGLLIHKQIKSNPNFIRYTKAVSSQDEIIFFDDTLHEILAKDISIMNRDTSFSNPLTLQPNFYMLRGLHTITFHELQEKSEKLVEEITLDI